MATGKAQDGQKQFPRETTHDCFHSRSAAREIGGSLTVREHSPTRRRIRHGTVHERTCNRKQSRRREPAAHPGGGPASAPENALGPRRDARLRCRARPPANDTREASDFPHEMLHWFGDREGEGRIRARGTTMNRHIRPESGHIPPGASRKCGRGVVGLSCRTRAACLFPSQIGSTS